MTFTFKLSKRLALTFAAIGTLVWGCTDVPSGSNSTPIVVNPPFAVGDTLFSDGFESGTLAWDDNYAPQAKAIVTAAARTGTRGLRVTYSPTGDGGVVSKFVAPGDRVYARAAVRFPTTWTGATGLLTLRAAPATNPWAGFGTAGVCPSGTTHANTGVTTTTPNLDLRFSTYYVGMSTCQPNAGLSGSSTATYTPPLAASKGAWHVVEIEAQLNTVGLSDGWQRVWLDGSLIGQWNGLKFRTSSSIQWNAVSLELPSTGVTQTQALDIDDILVLRQQPAAPVPVATVQVTPATATVNINATLALAATLRDAAGNTLTNRTVAWSSSNAAVATVNGSGVVTALAAGSATITATSEGQTGSSAVTVPAPAPSAQVLLSETFDDTQFGGRGWYDYSSPPVVTTADKHSGTGALQLQWAAGSMTPPMRGMRRLFTATDRLYVSYWVKYSSNYVGSGRTYHPHEFNVLSNQDQDWDGLTFNYLNTYIEQNYQSGGIPRVSIQDSRMIDISKIGVNLTGVTENRSVAGCNGNADASSATQCYQATPAEWYNIREFNGTGVAFRPTTGTDYKGNWNHVEVELQLNTVAGGIGQANGVMRYWLNGNLKMERTNVLFRTGANPNLKFRQFLFSPYIGDGSPVAQTMWVDDLVLATSRDSTVAPPAPVPAPVASVTVTPGSATVAVNATTQLSVVTRDAAGATLTGRTVTWSTSASGIATVVNGLVTGRGAGQATITATSEGRTGSATITVPATAVVPVATVTVTPSTTSLAVAAVAQLTALTRDAAGATLTGRTITWSTSASGIATVVNGLVTAIGVGQATITATSEGRSGSATITVSLPIIPPVGGSVPELPSGYSLRALWTGSPAPPAGWATGWAGSVQGSATVITDLTAPASVPLVTQITYPAGFHSGDEPQTWEYSGTNGASGITFTYWFKYSAGFQGEQSSVNKHLFLFATDGSVIGYTAMRFSGTSSTGYLDWLFEGGATGSTAFTWLASNRSQVNLSTWHRVTVEVRAPTVRLWIDGQLVGSTTSASLKSIGVMKVAPTWGGNTGDRMRSAGRLFFDDIRISTR